MRTRAANLALFGALGAAVAALGAFANARRAAPRVIDVLPRATAVVVELDLAALRESGLATLPLPGGVDAVSRGCGEAPLAAVDRLALALPALAMGDAPGDAREGELAIVGVGSRVRAGVVVDCARQLVEARGRTVTVARRDDFTLVQEGDGARGVLAVRDGGPVLLGKGAWFEAVLASASGKAPSLRGDALHDVERSTRAGALAIATWSLADGERASLAKQLPEALRVLAGVRGVVLDARDDGHGGLAILVDAVCDPGASDALARWIDGAKSGFAAEPFVAALGLGAAIRDARVGARSDRARASFAIAAPALSAALSR